MTLLNRLALGLAIGFLATPSFSSDSEKKEAPQETEGTSDYEEYNEGKEEREDIKEYKEGDEEAENLQPRYSRQKGVDKSGNPVEEESKRPTRSSYRIHQPPRPPVRPAPPPRPKPEEKEKSEKKEEDKKD